MVEVDELRHVGVTRGLTPVAHGGRTAPVLLLFDRATKMLRARCVHRATSLASGSSGTSAVDEPTQLVPGTTWAAEEDHGLGFFVEAESPPTLRPLVRNGEANPTEDALHLTQGTAGCSRRTGLWSGRNGPQGWGVEAADREDAKS